MVDKKTYSMKISEEAYKKLHKLKLVPTESFDGVLIRILKAIEERNIRWKVEELNGNKPQGEPPGGTNGK